MYKHKDVVCEFLDYCKYEKNLSPKSISAYKIDLNQFLVFMNSVEDSSILLSITKTHVRDYISYMLGRYAVRSAKRKIATLKALYSFLAEEDRIEHSPLASMRIRLGTAKIMPRTMNLSVVKALFAVAQARCARAGTRSARDRAARDLALIELMFGTGMRVSELCSLRLDDLDLLSGTLIVQGKGEKERVIPLCNDETVHVVRDYIDLHRPEHTDSPYVFPGRCLEPGDTTTHGHLSDQTVRSTLRILAREADIPEHITPHMFRHTLATLLLDNGVDIRNIQHLLGHSSIAVTEIYTHVSKQAQRKTLETKHPRRLWNSDN